MIWEDTKATLSNKTGATLIKYFKKEKASLNENVNTRDTIFYP